VHAETLAYDDLPPGSDIRREYDGHSLQITVPAGEPPAAVIKQAAYDALARGAASSWALLLLAFVAFYFGVRANRISGAALVWAWMLFAVFCGALVMLVAWIRFGLLVDAIRAGRRQATLIAATRERLLIETAGPFGTMSIDLPRERVGGVRSASGAVRDQNERSHRVSFLRIGDTVLLPGRERREIEWVAAALRNVLGLTETRA
jgi:hypothetical protein